MTLYGKELSFAEFVIAIVLLHHKVLVKSNQKFKFEAIETRFWCRNSRALDRPRGDVRALHRRALLAYAEGAHPTFNHSKLDLCHRLLGHEFVWESRW